MRFSHHWWSNSNNCLNDIGVSTYIVLSFIYSLANAVLSGVAQGLQPLWGKVMGNRIQKRSMTISALACQWISCCLFWFLPVWLFLMSRLSVFLIRIRNLYLQLPKHCRFWPVLYSHGFQSGLHLTALFHKKDKAVRYHRHIQRDRSKSYSDIRYSCYFWNRNDLDLPGLLRAYLKIAFWQMYVTICRRFEPNEGRIAGYVTWIWLKYTAKWGRRWREWIFKHALAWSLP